ncbi:MAG: SEC-C domain-containing protein [Deltaproteobacteria bacterium]|nr:SEC-C domain-containing protein [Deltaproteobacteria bacterium]
MFNRLLSVEQRAACHYIAAMLRYRLRDIGRNDMCICGSEKKYKKCHGQ